LYRDGIRSVASGTVGTTEVYYATAGQQADAAGPSRSALRQPGVVYLQDQHVRASDGFFRRVDDPLRCAAVGEHQWRFPVDLTEIEELATDQGPGVFRDCPGSWCKRSVTGLVRGEHDTRGSWSCLGS
jgi:hypothetical protein